MWLFQTNRSESFKDPQRNTRSLPTLGNRSPPAFVRTVVSNPYLTAFRFNQRFTFVDVGSTLYRYGESFAGVNRIKITKAGILDDVELLNTNELTKEVYVKGRVTWLQPHESAAQYPGEH